MENEISQWEQTSDEDFLNFEQTNIKKSLLEKTETKDEVSTTELWQKLFEEGLITHVPKDIPDEDDDFEPIEIEGEPISETIIRIEVRMSAYFCDSSGLAKRYIAETGSGWVIGLLKPSADNVIFIASITAVEVVSAIARRRKGLSLSQLKAQKAIFRFQRDFRRRFVEIPLKSQLVEDVMTIADKYELRGYDAVQLASAIDTNRLRLSRNLSPIIFVSADNNLNSAAQGEGLTVDNPNSR